MSKPNGNTDAAEIEALAAELYAEAAAAGVAWYSIDVARAAARSRLGELESYGADWDAAAAVARASVVKARIAAAA